MIERSEGSSESDNDDTNDCDAGIKPKSKRLLTETGNRPRKRFFRSRPHINPLSRNCRFS